MLASELANMFQKYPAINNSGSDLSRNSGSAILRKGYDRRGNTGRMLTLHRTVPAREHVVDKASCT